MNMWKQFYDYWIEIAKSHTIPVYFLRYEDLMFDATRILTEIFEFALDSPSLQETYIEKRIKEVVSRS